jgi:adenine deaminase
MLAEKLIQIAMGREEASLYLKNGRIVNVFTGEIVTGKGVAVGQGRIAYVGSGERMIGSGTKVLDCRGMYLVPGYIDVHSHADFFTNPVAFTRLVLPTGTTVTMTETSEICGALGFSGLDYMLEVTSLLPLKFYFSLPSCIPPLPELEGDDCFPVSLLEKYLEHPRVLALGEITSWPRVTSLDRSLIEKIHLVKKAGKRVEGHLTGCREEEMNALVAAGITSCHESITAQEAKEKLSLGLYVMLRHGSVRRDLPELSRLITGNPGLNTSRVILALDSMFPEDILCYGYVNDLIRAAASYGINPIKAIQMVTLNPATYLGLDCEVGSIAPGRRADILLVENIGDGFPRMVIAEGKIVAENGKLCEDVVLPDLSCLRLRPPRWPPGPFSAEDFLVKAPAGAGSFVEVPVMDIINKTIIKRIDLMLPVREGIIEPDPANDVLKISLARPGGGFTTGFIKGFGGDIAGLATTLPSYNHKVLALGKNGDDMAFALTRMMELNGGMVLVENGKVIAEAPLSIGGIQSAEEVDVLAGQFSVFKRCLKEKGCLLEDPLFTLHFVNMTGLPYIRITPKGIVDVITKEVIFP